MPRVGEDFVAPVLEALAESLDVRDIFARISTEAQRAITHDVLILGLAQPDGRHMRVMALSRDAPPPREVEVPPVLQAAVQSDGFILRDVTVGDDGSIVGALLADGKPPAREVRYPMQPFFRDLLQARGLRSFLRVPVRLRGEMLGGLIFCSTAPAGFTESELPPAKQIAACVALALAHQRLALEEQRSAEARARADRLEARVKRQSEELAAEGRHRTLGSSQRWRDVLRQATRVAATEATVLLTGESGTGKEVIARLVHRASPRAQGPFVALNCAALPEQLLESELFGHERGAFTGAQNAHAGKIEQAAGGVLFLDEVGEMSAAVQAKFLRVLEEREYQRLGSARTQRADIRVVAATNRDLRAETGKGNFREDLYYRLAVFDLSLPPLRERRDDIALLADAFLADAGRAMGVPARGFSPAARDRLIAHAWPGNVRELRNAIERAAILSDGGVVLPEHLPPQLSAGATPSAKPDGLLETTEREMIAAALARTGNNKSKAARLLGLTRAQLRSRIEKHGLL